MGEVIYRLNRVFIFWRRPLEHISKSFRSQLILIKNLIKEQITRRKTLLLIYNKVAGIYRKFRSKTEVFKSPRVYIKKGISRMEFFKVLNERNVDYVVLRWWEDLPEIPEGEDMDILLRDEHRYLINDLVTFKDNHTGLKCDLYTIAGSNYGSRRNIPYFQANLAHTLIQTRVLYRGAYVPSPGLYFASLAYHAVFHKGNRSGLPGFKDIPEGVEHNYDSILKAQAHKLGLSIDVTVKGLFSWLEENDFVPAEDTLAKLVEIRPELSFLQKRLSSDSRGGDLIVYVIRERLVKDGFLQEFIKFIEEDFKFEILDVKKLSDTEKNICTSRVRGGKWDKGPYKYSGGAPEALIIAFDYHPQPPSFSELKSQSRMTNRNNFIAKYRFREKMQKRMLMKNHYNGLHSSDNENDAKYYISLLGDQYLKQIANKVEQIRATYATKGGVKKLLSFNRISKVELIHYGEALAVKKTFRQGKERFFQRELYAVKVLSKELSFIPPLLAEGTNYIIMPYLDNILGELPEEEKRNMISGKVDDVLDVIRSMYERKLTNLNFTSENLIITRDGKFYCTGFSFLQEYKNYPSRLENAYEFKGVPKKFLGDVPQVECSFNEVWAPYLAKEKELKYKLFEDKY